MSNHLTKLIILQKWKNDFFDSWWHNSSMLPLGVLLWAAGAGENNQMSSMRWIKWVKSCYQNHHFTKIEKQLFSISWWKWRIKVLSRYEVHPASCVLNYSVHPTSCILKYSVHPTSCILKYNVHRASSILKYDVHPTSYILKYSVHPTSCTWKYCMHRSSYFLKYNLLQSSYT